MIGPGFGINFGIDFGSARRENFGRLAPGSRRQSTPMIDDIPQFLGYPLGVPGAVAQEFFDLGCDLGCDLASLAGNAQGQVG